MLYIEGAKIKGIYNDGVRIISGHYINSFIYIDDTIKITGAEYINQGDSSFYTLTIDGHIHSDINITCETTGVTIINNKVIFNKIGQHTLNINYKTITLQQTVYVSDITLNLN